MYSTTYTNLSASTLDKAAHEKTCNYWYTVRSQAISHIAFNKRENFLKWLEYRGLSLDGELPPHGTLDGVGIIGSYRTSLHLDYEEFLAISPVYSIRTMCNGDWVEGKVTIDEDGIHTVRSMNPNYQRVVFDYRESHEMYG